MFGLFLYASANVHPAGRPVQGKKGNDFMRTIREARQDKDLETMMNVVNNDPGHIARAKAKRDRILRQQAEAAEAPKPMEPETAALGVLSGVCMWCLSLVALL
jgi:hypothetical protein